MLCRGSLEPLRWPAGIGCRSCGEQSGLLWLEPRAKRHCYGCRDECSVTARTVFHDSHPPRWKRFVAVHLTLRAPEGISASSVAHRIHARR